MKSLESVENLFFLCLWIIYSKASVWFFVVQMFTHYASLFQIKIWTSNNLEVTNY